jgi:hypothetical protein
MQFTNRDGEQGLLYITATVGGPADKKITYTLTEYDFSGTGVGGRLIETTDALPVASNTHIHRFFSSNFNFGKWYTVSYVLSSTFSGATTAATTVLASRLEYRPKGYDILVFSGQSNMGGRDTAGPALLGWTSDERSTGITYRGATIAKKVVSSVVLPPYDPRSSADPDICPQGETAELACQ